MSIYGFACTIIFLVLLLNHFIVVESLWKCPNMENFQCKYTCFELQCLDLHHNAFKQVCPHRT